MVIQINISNRGIYTFLLIISLIILATGVYAYGTSTPSNFGHDTGEIFGPTDCDTIDTDANGIMSCGSDSDTTYSAGSGITLTGTTFSTTHATDTRCDDATLDNRCGNVYADQLYSQGDVILHGGLYAMSGDGYISGSLHVDDGGITSGGTITAPRFMGKADSAGTADSAGSASWVNGYQISFVGNRAITESCDTVCHLTYGLNNFVCLGAGDPGRNMFYSPGRCNTADNLNCICMHW